MRFRFVRLCPPTLPRVLLRAERRLGGILKICSPEPVELFSVVTMISIGGALLHDSRFGILPLPFFFGGCLVVNAFVGMAGLLFRLLPLRLFYAMMGFVFNLWMGQLYLMRNPHDPTWAGRLAAVVAFLWLAARLWCDCSKREGRKQGFQSGGTDAP